MASSRGSRRECDLGDRPDIVAVEHVGNFHRPLLVRDDDELCPVCVAARQLAGGRCSCRRAPPRPRRGGTLNRRARKSAPRRIAPSASHHRQERQARHALARGAQLDLDPGFLVLGLRLGQPQPPRRPGRASATSAKLPRQPCTSPRSARTVSSRSPAVLQLLQALLEIGALCRGSSSRSFSASYSCFASGFT